MHDDNDCFTTFVKVLSRLLGDPMNVANLSDFIARADHGLGLLKPVHCNIRVLKDKMQKGKQRRSVSRRI